MVSNASPYSDLPPAAFWRSAVADPKTDVASGLYQKKFTIGPKDQIATAGSCFAQYIGRQLKDRGFSVIDREPPPAGLKSTEHGRFGFSIYSARYGNVYTVRQMLQLAKEAFGEWTPTEIAWQNEAGRYFDALRPGVEPDGLGSVPEVTAHRREHLKAVAAVLSSMDIFIFTMGLTEAWIESRRGTVFPTAPGTIAGSYDPEVYEFHNFRFDEIHSDFVELMDVLHRNRRKEHQLRVIVTVSPVPLTATASGKHVLASTIYSKSVLRGVAGQLTEEFDYIDYFPAFEIICNPWSRDLLYDRNMRNVRPEGVAKVMRTFFAEHGEAAASAEITMVEPRPLPNIVPADGRPSSEDDRDELDVVCEEELLNAFGRRTA